MVYVGVLWPRSSVRHLIGPFFAPTAPTARVRTAVSVILNEPPFWVEPCSSIAVTRMAAVGATSSLPVALAKVRSKSDLPTFVIARCRTAVCGVHVLRPGQPPEGELYGSEGHEGGQSFRKVLGVLGETPVTL